MSSAIVIVGGTGNVGRTILRHWKGPKPIVVGSERSVGRTLHVGDRSFTVQPLELATLKERWVLFCTEADLAKEWVPQALSVGARVVDSSSAFRMDPAVPLIVPPVNSHQITLDHRLYAHANCIVSPLTIVLAALRPLQLIRRVVVSTYQSVSGAGRKAMESLRVENQVLERDDQNFAGTVNSESFPYGIANRTLPYIGDQPSQSHDCGEETKIIQETQKILQESFPILVTAVRVPIMVGHSLSVAIEWENDVLASDVTQALRQAQSVQVVDDPETLNVDAIGDNVAVSRIRCQGNWTQLWTLSHNLRRGAATDAMEILERVISLQSPSFLHRAG